MGSGYQFATASHLDVYLASGEHGNEGIIHRPKDESEFLAKKKTFEANIFKFFLKWSLFQSFGVLQIRILTVSCVVRFATFIPPGNFSRAQPPIPLGNFHLLNPRPLGISNDHPWGGWGMDIFWNHTLLLGTSLQGA